MAACGGHAAPMRTAIAVRAWQSNATTVPVSACFLPQRPIDWVNRPTGLRVGRKAGLGISAFIPEQTTRAGFKRVLKSLRPCAQMTPLTMQQANCNAPGLSLEKIAV
jgi:hypothetical protein